ncbi:unnamed protein product [Ranitomeya imitator]|uniref:Legumain n=1 Tax=Ranitomeya imitator TaxID=111125 RepID=A0ABN9M0Q3_9NEOB|nr:unnamed protein product [Ranitomeya imitator]
MRGRNSAPTSPHLTMGQRMRRRNAAVVQFTMVPTTLLLFCLVALSTAMPIEDPEDDGKHWVILVAGSNGWYNYRHQADLCHAYQIVKKNGIPDEQIVVMMYDDIADNEENPTKGIIINRPNGSDVYAGVPKDYTGEDVTPANFLAVLKGDSKAVKGKGSGKVIQRYRHTKRRCSDTDNDPDRCSVAVWSLESCHTDSSPATNDPEVPGIQGKHRVTKLRAALSNPMFTLVTIVKPEQRSPAPGTDSGSGPNDHVFVYFTDHGAPGLLAFPNDDLHVEDLNATIKYMYENKKYKRMVLYIEACESGSMMNHLPSTINVYATTAANPHESSYACYYDAERDTYLGDQYSVSWMEDSDVVSRTSLNV